MLNAPELEKLSGFYSICTNGSGELFVQLTQNGPALRIGPYDKRNGEMSVTSHSGRFTPWSIHGLSAFIVTKR